MGNGIVFFALAVAVIAGNEALSSRGVTRSGALSGEGKRRVHNTFVLAKENGQWRIVHHMIMDARK